MNIKKTVAKQYIRLVDMAVNQPLSDVPSEGWITTVRKALGMSVQQLADRLAVSRGSIYQAEQNERSKAISIGQMEKLAEAMGGRFVYGIVPNGSVEVMIMDQARMKARSVIHRTNAHMALEKQALQPDALNEEIESLAREIAEKRPSDLWATE
ncbi:MULTISPECIES: mobile mystery protein A [unclassified Rhizobium]|uniref:mobile mystery protein A n=1 Tax=unclassified Rhizobium TaxID=2613769 RepID=UPI000EA9D8BD|nr:MULTISPECIES: mobile mystery protein A [unclassified Rhizobium]AYG67585.1 mobile mystery protein A [Rhizobium sp. CCGE531]AYG73979.1 mobile mystery protein A [Rhizobium sp. CCGE532]